MAEVQLSIAGRGYSVHCRDGEEPRLQQLARMISDRVDKVKQTSPGLTEVRQLLFAALLLADDLSDAQSNAAKATPPPPAEDPATLQALESLAERLEAIGQALAADGAAA
jgi:cell division protein ZapA